MSALRDRRQRAREAGWDATAGWSQESTQAAIEAAVETATRVKLTPEVIEAASSNWTPSSIARGVLRAAGFEVIE